MRQPNNMSSSVISTHSMHIGLFATASHAISTGTLFSVFYWPRTSRSEFVVSVNRYLEARSHKLSVGMRFKMRFEGEEVPERSTPPLFGGFCLNLFTVQWDEPSSILRPERVSPRELEPLVAASSPSLQPLQRKRARPPVLPSPTPDLSALGMAVFVNEKRQGTTNGYRLFGIELLDNSAAEQTIPVITASGAVAEQRPVPSLDAESDGHSEPSNINRSDFPSVSCEPEKSSCLILPQESQSRQIRSCTKRMNNSSRTKLRLSKKLRHLNPKPFHDLAFLYVRRENGAHFHSRKDLVSTRRIRKALSFYLFSSVLSRYN
ncbi:hypothetical protein RHMOL_Rhmol13G0252800 [Rhododendron molle]|uniref:Uncharacterized protein n=2 Tax=Rhododendron molle TaxID=49168 RepID=A0ACC0LBN2_RHOML|nr:hypothetical protein RHMOL_Rhmol13G0252800 [Rhododendron molle]KAI8525732.1 hypothetical protein RHMOL_Rhmol13G0252800 [Rhododendron molle]